MEAARRKMVHFYVDGRLRVDIDATDNYNLWIKSGDVGILCYEYDGETWQYNPDAVKPDYIQQEDYHAKTSFLRRDAVQIA